MIQLLPNDILLTIILQTSAKDTDNLYCVSLHTKNQVLLHNKIIFNCFWKYTIITQSNYTLQGYFKDDLKTGKWIITKPNKTITIQFKNNKFCGKYTEHSNCNILVYDGIIKNRYFSSIREYHPNGNIKSIRRFAKLNKDLSLNLYKKISEYNKLVSQHLYNDNGVITDKYEFNLDNTDILDCPNEFEYKFDENGVVLRKCSYINGRMIACHKYKDNKIIKSPTFRKEQTLKPLIDIILYHKLICLFAN